MKQFFNHLIVFIVLLNSGCGKQAFFYNIKQPTRLPPAPRAPFIPPQPLIISNKQAYSLIKVPFLPTAKYTYTHQVPQIELPNMRYTPYIIGHTPSVVDVRLGLNPYSNTINIETPSMVYTPYMNPANISILETTDLGSSSDIPSFPIIETRLSSFTSYMNPANISILETTDLGSSSDIPSFPIIETRLSSFTSYMNPANISILETTDLRSSSDIPSFPIIETRLSSFTSYMNPANISILETTDLRSSSNIPSFPIIETKLSSFTSYMNPVDVNTFITDLRPTPSTNAKKPSITHTLHINPVSINTDNLEIDTNSNLLTTSIKPLTHNFIDATTNLKPSTISMPSPTIDTDLEPTQPQNIPNVFNIEAEYKRKVFQSIDIQPDIKIDSIIKRSPPVPPEIIEKRSQHELHDTFTYTPIEDSFFQSTYNKNKTTLLFRAFDSYGLNIRNLQEEELTLSENQIEVTNYTLSSQSQKLDHTLEVVFAIDTGGSMDEYDHIVKENITYLVNKLAETQLHTSFCFVAFKDLVKRHCNNFFPDNPLTPQNDNILKFLSDISRLEFQRGGSYHQNALGGVLSASQAPWNANTQRIVILITDALFWTSVNKGESKGTAPDYEDVLKSLTDNNIQAFTLAQDYDGFSKDYFGHPSLSDATSGQWFDIKNLNDQDMDNILGQIRDQIDITYKIEYFVEDQEGLNALLPLEDRYISLTSNLAVSTDVMDIQIEAVHSSTPDGSQQLQSYWRLNQNTAINENYVFVTVNEQPEYDFSIENGEIVFSNPPPSGSKIFIQYEAGRLRDNIREHPILLPTDPKHQDSSNIQIDSVSLKLNDVIVSDQDFEITFSDPTENIQLHLSENIFDDTDPYNIRSSGELKISLWYEVISQHSSVN